MNVSAISFLCIISLSSYLVVERAMPKQKIPVVKKTNDQSPRPTTTFEIDLGSNIKTQNINLPNRSKIQVKIKNMLPDGEYSVSTSIAISVRPALDPAMLSKERCPNFMSEYFKVKDEIQLAAILDKYPLCREADSIFKASSRTLAEVSLNNQEFKVTIINLKSNKTWIYTFVPSEKGKFLTTYGFTYIPSLFSKTASFFSEPTADRTNSFTIRRATDTHKAEFAPTLMFHYFSSELWGWSLSPTAGLGLDLTGSETGVSPIVSAGLSFLYKRNIGASFGLASHRQSVLKGNYMENQIINSNLESKDLTEKVTRFNPFVSITFRFNRNPFKSSETDLNNE